VVKWLVCILVPTTTTPYEQTSMDAVNNYDDAERTLKQLQDNARAAQFAAEQVAKEEAQCAEQIQRAAQERVRREERAREEEAARLAEKEAARLAAEEAARLAAAEAKRFAARLAAAKATRLTAKLAAEEARLAAEELARDLEEKVRLAASMSLLAFTRKLKNHSSAIPRARRH
jgi:NADH dehydrogenase [ubiquinone] 1 alpha subcomplex assembly factor 7